MWDNILEELDSKYHLKKSNIVKKDMYMIINLSEFKISSKKGNILIEKLKKRYPKYSFKIYGPSDAITGMYLKVTANK
ncbi:hypothetical protein [Enterococcus gilvus]|uniref:hypothetical protein n=1 Tax=Enterococcus gilvus TaxID=160453 RepID=UPI0028D46861|nr:hypothetical protein [Enterococcus gilvus]